MFLMRGMLAFFAFFARDTEKNLLRPDLAFSTVKFLPSHLSMLNKSLNFAFFLSPSSTELQGSAV